ncbi:hypothetical protein C1H76_6821 [Elsinoe australis]|uniref:Uncharacterized protein n=1 Tax=Elsinoe australis TaxID=40998 RepID=A0A4U7AWF5_9PEZI|nr:hypothetical protein C1H76_6821 [Elsinoe australis]
MPQARNGDKAKSDKAGDVGNKAMGFSILVARKVLGELEKFSEQKSYYREMQSKPPAGAQRSQNTHKKLRAIPTAQVTTVDAVECLSDEWVDVQAELDATEADSCRTVESLSVAQNNESSPKDIVNGARAGHKGEANCEKYLAVFKTNTTFSDVWNKVSFRTLLDVDNKAKVGQLFALGQEDMAEWLLETMAGYGNAVAFEQSFHKYQIRSRNNRVFCRVPGCSTVCVSKEMWKEHIFDRHSEWYQKLKGGLRVDDIGVAHGNMEDAYLVAIMWLQKNEKPSQKVASRSDSFLS